MPEAFTFIYTRIYLHPPGINHRHDVAASVRHQTFGISLGHKYFHSIHAEQGNARTEAESLGCRYTYTQTRVGTRSRTYADRAAVRDCDSAFIQNILDIPNILDI